ncbi:hypothetical protein [Sphingobium sp. YR768]|uniref:hypothetical protein n=1 Tax=Sphingobium sp. YR768 TaxID=1884365 RepID=UPI0008BE04F9|nr:hypothetical protein [Sphingobium sp. YR768]SER96481.1 hypothetical protein SAMN05518866_12744 [Sphingobium sp. YR768]
MAKGQKKSNPELRKPKAEKPKKQNASNPTQKPGAVNIVTLKSQGSPALGRPIACRCQMPALRGRT